MTRIPVSIVSYRDPGDIVECLSAFQGSAAGSGFDEYISENGGAAAFDTLLATLTKAEGPCDDDTASKPTANRCLGSSG